MKQQFSWHTLLITIFLFSVIDIRTSQAMDSTSQGMLFYNSGHLDEAKSYFQKKLSSAPRDAQAHYMLGNIFSRQKLFSEAKREYELAQAVNRNSTIGKFSTEALSRLNAILTADSEQLPANKAAINQIKTSVQSIGEQTDDQERRQQRDCQAKLVQLYKEADYKAKKLEDELKEKIAENGQAEYTNLPSWNPGAIRRGNFRTVKTYDPEPANQALREDYEAQINQIKQDTSLKAENLKKEYKSRERALEDSALVLDKSYIAPRQDGEVTLAPSGTNMYIRNYRLPQHPSGDTLPIRVAPAKSLNSRLISAP